MMEVAMVQAVFMDVLSWNRARINFLSNFIVALLKRSKGGSDPPEPKLTKGDEKRSSQAILKDVYSQTVS